MIPYTPDTVDTIRAAVRGGQTADMICGRLGWDLDMLTRICRRHRIDVPPPARPVEILQQATRANGVTVLDHVRFEQRQLGAAVKPAWRVLLISRFGYRYVNDLARGSKVNFAMALSAVCEAGLMSGEAYTVDLLEKGEVRRDVYCNVRLMPGVEKLMLDIARIRKCKPTVLLASIIERRAIQSVASA